MTNTMTREQIEAQSQIALETSLIAANGNPFADPDEIAAEWQEMLLEENCSDDSATRFKAALHILETSRA